MGDRAAKSALYIVAIVRMSHHPQTRQYLERRTAEGLTKREIIRCIHSLESCTRRYPEVLNQPFLELLDKHWGICAFNPDRVSEEHHLVRRCVEGLAAIF